LIYGRFFAILQTLTIGLNQAAGRNAGMPGNSGGTKMDISGIYGRHPVQATRPGKTSEAAGFKEIFEQKVSSVSEVGLPASGGNEAGLIERSGKILDLLDKYIQELNDPAKTLKDIDPLVKNISEEMTLLESGSTDSVAKAGGLGGFVQELAVTTNVALYKFRRGDYL